MGDAQLGDVPKLGAADAFGRGCASIVGGATASTKNPKQPLNDLVMPRSYARLLPYGDAVRASWAEPLRVLVSELKPRGLRVGLCS